MKPIFALIAGTLLASISAAKAPPRDWTTTVSRAPDGAFVVGNPAAKVKLVEYASYTCPHCAHFAGESEPGLSAKIKTGTVSLTFRHAIRDKLDLTAAIAARCARYGFLGASEAIFAAQQSWYPRGADYANLNDGRLSKYPEGDRLKAYADGAGLTDLMKARGLTDAQLAACYADAAERATVAGLADAAWATIKGTPSFFVNGKPVATIQWAELAPMLRAPK
jgi:protein-disulfide isomerase